MGKALLMDSDLEGLQNLATGTPFVPLTASTPPSVEQLALNIAAARADGFATSFGEAVAGCATIAVPMRDRVGRIVAALGVSGPSFRFTLDRLREAGPAMMEAAQEITQSMGWDRDRAPLVRRP